MSVRAFSASRIAFVMSHSKSTEVFGVAGRLAWFAIWLQMPNSALRRSEPQAKTGIARLRPIELHSQLIFSNPVTNILLQVFIF